MNSGTLRTLANATSGQHELLGRMNVPRTYVRGRPSEETATRAGPEGEGAESGNWGNWADRSVEANLQSVACVCS